MTVLEDHAVQRDRIKLGMFGCFAGWISCGGSEPALRHAAPAASICAMANSVDSTTRLYNQVSLLSRNPGEEAHHCQAMTCREKD
jgi:hypothetical protein